VRVTQPLRDSNPYCRLERAAQSVHSVQPGIVEQFTDLVTKAAGDPGYAKRVWVLLTEAAEGGWGLWGHAHTNAELVEAARAQIAELSAKKS
jgi:hypothetical protein